MCAAQKGPKRLFYPAKSYLFNWFDADSRHALCLRILVYLVIYDSERCPLSIFCSRGIPTNQPWVYHQEEADAVAALFDRALANASLCFSLDGFLILIRISSISSTYFRFLLNASISRSHLGAREGLAETNCQHMTKKCQYMTKMSTYDQTVKIWQNFNIWRNWIVSPVTTEPQSPKP